MSAVAYGRHAVLSLLQHRAAHVTRVLLQQPMQASPLMAIAELAQAKSVPLEWVDKSVLVQSIAPTVRHQGVVAHYQMWSLPGESELVSHLMGMTNPFVFILDSIQDPHNLGACLRSAAAVGVDAVVLPKDKSARLTAVTHHVAAGASFALPVFQVTNLARTMRAIQKLGIWIYGTAGDGTVPLYQNDFRGPTAIVMGGEGSGMRHLTRKHCDHLVHIPMNAATESLNVSVAAGVCLYEIYRQRQVPT